MLNRTQNGLRILMYVSFNTHRMAHGLALLLKERLPGARFAAVTFRESIEGYYLANECDGLFEDVVSESRLFREARDAGFPGTNDDFLEVERKYGRPTIWPYAMVDRRITMRSNGWLYDEGTEHDERQLKAILLHRFRSLESCLDRFDPNLIIYPHPDTGPGLALALQGVAERRDIPMLVPHRSRIGPYVTLTHTVYNRIPRIERRFNELRDGAASENKPLAGKMLQDFRAGELRYTKSGPDVGKRPSLAGKLATNARRIRTVIRNYRHRGYSSDPYFTSWFARRADDVRASWRTWRIRSSVRFETPRSDQRYVFVPLHVQPEMSTLLFAPYFVNQLDFVRNIAQSTPANTTVYVKEHPVMISKGLRTAGYLKQLARIPNVHLVDGDTTDLIKGAERVITVTGTPALEAVLLDTPVTLFGDVYFNFLKKRVSRIEEYKSLLHELGTTRETAKLDDGELIDFLTAVVDSSCAVNLDQINVRSRQTNLGSLIGDHDLNRYCDYLVSSMPDKIQLETVSHSEFISQ